jgi:hypothetical protein
MAAVTVERFHSRKARLGEGVFEELLAIITGTSDDDEARTAFLDWLPTTRTVNSQILSLSYAEVEIVGTESFKGIAHYGKLDGEPGDSVFSFEVTTATEHITQSIDTISSTAYSGTAPDYKGAIGVNEKGDVEGVDIFFPRYASTERHTIAAATVTNAFKQQLFALVGKVANATFKEYAQGECLFVGAQGSTKDDGDWEVTYSFAGRPNETNVTIPAEGGDMVIASVKGWEYLWIQYEAVKDNTAKRIVRQPRFAYVEQLYELGDFSLLGIGT